MSEDNNNNNKKDLTFTENLSLTFATSKDERLDFFFHVIEGSSQERTIELLEKSWNKSPLDTMKMIINCRDIRGGKGIRAQALICFKWLYENQFDNLMLNLIYFDEFGCWKDYLNLLIIALFNQLPYDVDTKLKKNLYTHIKAFDTKILQSISKEKRHELEMIPTICRQIERKFILIDPDKIHDENKPKEKYSRQIIKEKHWDGQQFNYKKMKNLFPNYDEKFEVKKFFYKYKTSKGKLRKLNEYRREYFNNQYENDNKFQKIYNKIVDLFVEQLIKDYDNLLNENLKKISLACKWLPNYGRYFDKYLFIFESIAKKFFKIKSELLLSINNNNNTNNEKQIIISLSKICSKLRRKIQIPELLMSSNLWDQIDYKHVPSIAMLRYRQTFVRSDFKRFNNFINNKSLNAGALTPADLVKQVMNGPILNINLLFESLPENLSEEQLINLKVIDNQWQSLVDTVRKNGSLLFSNTLVVCDVSSSMYMSAQSILPIHGAIGLTMFIMEITDDVWNNRFISFSQKPSFHQINMKETLVKRCKEIISADWGCNTDLNKVFDLIINYGKEQNLTSEQMPKILFIFTDMEFDAALPEKTNFEAAQLQFKLANYQMPFIIFWNLKGEKISKSTPVQCNENGVILLSGFSAQQFKFLLNMKDLNEFNPLSMLLKIINDSRYDCIKIVE